MNQISLDVKKIPAKECLSIDGIEFTNSILITLAIDGVSTEKLKHLDVALVVFKELHKSLFGDGRYLIFTSTSGIADDGGWEGVDVKFNGDFIEWDFEVENTKYHFEFDVFQYKEELQSLEKNISILKQKFELEPSEVFFPEDWR